jgi:Na+-transporting NADH:ubiquinone oxidoreductase subunit NqrE
MTLSGFLIRGVIPAICLGLGTVLMRASLGAGASIPVYLVLVGSTVAVLGWGATFLLGAAASTPRAVVFAIAMGACWTLAIACMAYGMSALKLPVSVVAPLINSNALAAVLVGAIAFTEWRSLNLPLVALGTALICSGATSSLWPNDGTVG